MAVDYGLLDGNAVLKRLCNTDARIWDPSKADCSSDISLKQIRNKMAFFFVVVCMISSYMQKHYMFLFIISPMKTQKIYE